MSWSINPSHVSERSFPHVRWYTFMLYSCGWIVKIVYFHNLPFGLDAHFAYVTVDLAVWVITYGDFNDESHGTTERRAEYYYVTLCLGHNLLSLAIHFFNGDHSIFSNSDEACAYYIG
ncbi:hypothetical protein LCGC14_1712390 [marine sediment metagenome]|uniref:Uncharacterized protein n=1 Tax=marine sediment metagenome TaxID=412755 RepID=A0A0F9I284_9ZZZZ